MVDSDSINKLVGQFERLNKQFQYEYCINHYLNQAQQLVGAEVTEKADPELLAIIGHCKSALDAAEVKDVNRLVYNFNWALQISHKLNIPAYQAQGVSLWLAEIAAKNRRPQLPKRAVICAMDAGYQTACEVENFLLNESSLTDGWGAFDIKTVQGAFILTDTDRNFTERTLEITRISTLISEIKKRFSD